jgi:hypothetical protein
MKDTEKRAYQAPKIEKVRLTVKNSVLGTCHVSPLPTAFTPQGCDVIFVGCYEGPGGAPIG